MVSTQKIYRKKEKLKFLIKEISYSLANSIRRSSQEIPILAIDIVEFYKNDSALSDEILAHRLGLIPLKTGKGITPREDCSCKGKGCSKCVIPIKLKATGPCTVYSKDLKMRGAEIIYGDMPIVILAKDQVLEFSAQASLGKGIEHAKFSPGLIYYNSYPIIDIKGDVSKECIDVCPLGAITENKGKIKIDPLKCDMCEACIEKCNEKKQEVIKITPSETDFIFTIESWGQLEPNELLIESVKALDNNFKDFSKELKKVKI
jgi:DNA-directed RNA polymerase subunit D